MRSITFEFALAPIPIDHARKPLPITTMPDSKPRDLVGVCEHAAEALIALLGRDDSIPSSLRRAADTAVNELLMVAKNLRAAKLNVDDEDIDGEQAPAH